MIQSLGNNSREAVSECTMGGECDNGPVFYLIIRFNYRRSSHLYLTWEARPPSSWLLMPLMINLAIYNYDGNTGSLVDNDTPFVVFMISPFSNSVQALFMTHTEANRWADHQKSHKVCLVSGFGARASESRGQAPSISGERWAVAWTRATWLNIGERSNTWGAPGGSHVTWYTLCHWLQTPYPPSGRSHSIIRQLQWS